MNWDAAGAIGEIVGALAVVTSLIYLSVQLRNQNRESRAAAMHEIWSVFRSSVAILGDHHMSAVYTRALSQEELSESEQMQLLIHIQNIYRVWEEAYMLWKHGRLDDDVWNSMRRQIEFVIGSHPFIHVWELRNTVYDPDFQQFIDSLPVIPPFLADNISGT